MMWYKMVTDESQW